jgi:uncharacterized protein YlxW (UPF0749 family)
MKNTTKYIVIMNLLFALLVIWNIQTQVKLHDKQAEIKELQQKVELRDSHIYDILRHLENCQENRDTLNNEVARLHGRRGDSFIE